MSPYLAIAAIFKNEAPYLQEWVNFHKLVGVDEFYLYDNESTDGGREVLEAEQSVHIYNWPGRCVQWPAYQDALRRSEHRARWIAFIDIDEFLYSPTLESLSTVLRHYETYAAVAACWAIYGTSGHKERQTSVLEAFTQRSHKYLCHDMEIGSKGVKLNAQVKSIVQKDRLRPQDSPINSHVFTCGAVDELKRPLQGFYAQTPTWRFLRINHYWSRSEEDALDKSRQPRADIGILREFEELTHPALNQVRDTEIQAYLPQVCEQISA